MCPARDGVRLGFYAQGEGPHLLIAKHLIASAAKHMPDVSVFQLTDGATPCLAGAEAIRIAEPMPMGVRRLTHYTRLPGDWLFVDTDVLIYRDVREVFEKPFDVAIASRDGTYMEGTQYARLMPYNFGVVFSRCPKFWEALLPLLKRLPAEAQEWGGEQRLMCEMAKRSPFKVEILSSAYNFTPHKQDDDLSHVAIAHFKGLRKAWITTHL